MAGTSALPTTTDAFSTALAGSDDSATVGHANLHNQVNDGVNKLGTMFFNYGKANLLVNGGLEVWQRGTTFSTVADATFTADRWQTVKTGTDVITTVAQETTVVDTGSGASLKFVYSHGNSNTTGMRQKLEDYLQLRGRTLSVSFRMRQGVASNIKPYIQDSVTGKTYAATSAATGSFVTYTVTALIDAAATSVYVGFDFSGASTSDTVYLDHVMVVVGSSPVNFQPRMPADDYAQCLRYFERKTTAGGFSPFGGGYLHTNAISRMFIPCSRKGGQPSITVNNPTNLCIAWNGANTALTSIAAGGSTPDGTWQTCNVSGTPLTAGQGALLLDNNSSAPSFDFEYNP